MIDSPLWLRKDLVELTAEAVASLPAQLGVYEIVNGDQTTKIGYAGGHDSFGLRSALVGELGTGTHFRHECTHGYLTRWQELLMVYQGEHGGLPAANQSDARLIGRLDVANSREAR